MVADNKYDIIVVPSTERRDSQGRFPDFEQDKLSDSKIYTGGNVRMEAALKAAQKYPEADFIMLGGWTKENSRLLSKAEDMKNFMKKELGTTSHEVNIETINSLPSTRGNLVALFNTLKNKPGRSVAILSNDYHIDRIHRLWEILKTEPGFENIPEPKFITVSQLSLKEAAAPESSEYQLRIRREANGQKALSEGNYTERSRIAADDILQLYPESFHTIFTQTEQASWRALHDELKSGQKRK